VIESKKSPAMIDQLQRVGDGKRMSVVSLPVTRPAGRMLVIANPAMQAQPLQILEKLGFEPQTVMDPYSAMAELLAPKADYRGIVLSLQSIYREEIAVIGALKRRLPELEIWLSHTDGRQAALAEAMRLGADGLLGDDGLHRIAGGPVLQDSFAPIAPVSSSPLHLPTMPQPATNDVPADEEDVPVSEPVLTADELRALLQEQPSMPPSGGNDN